MNRQDDKEIKKDIVTTGIFVGIPMILLAILLFIDFILNGMISSFYSKFINNLAVVVFCITIINMYAAVLTINN